MSAPARAPDRGCVVPRGGTIEGSPSACPLARQALGCTVNHRSGGPPGGTLWPHVGLHDRASRASRGPFGGDRVGHGIGMGVMDGRARFGTRFILLSTVALGTLLAGCSWFESTPEKPKQQE